MAWLIHYKHFSRIENTGVEITDFIYKEFIEILRERYCKEFKKHKDALLEIIYQKTSANSASWLMILPLKKAKLR